jgi:hypothetical protein
MAPPKSLLAIKPAPTTHTASHLPGMFITLSFTVPIWLVLHNLPYSLLYLAQSWSATYREKKDSKLNHSHKCLQASSFQQQTCYYRIFKKLRSIKP